jgi:predicted dinucleotide-binding enzyme
MSKIAILGAGRVGSVLAPALATSGYEVIVGSRGAAPDWLTAPITHASLTEATQAAQIVINATPGETSLERLSALKDDLAGKILVDVTNATERGQNGLPGGLMYPNSSLGARLQEALPETRVVKTLNTMLFMVMAAPQSLSNPATVFVSGDDPDAKEIVAQLLRDLGWDQAAILDLGGIGTARGPEAMILMVPDLLKARGFSPFALTIA